MTTDPFIKLFILLLIYVFILFILKKFNIGRKKASNKYINTCPDCENPLNRIKRLSKDKILFHITFRIFDFKRYLCTNCGWEGLRWEDRFHPKN